MRTYDGLRKAIADYCARAGITRQQLDADAFIADGHAAKLLAPAAVRRFGIVSLGRVLAALDLEIVVQVRADAAPRGLAPADACGLACDEPHPKDWRRKRGTSWARRMAARRALLLTAERRREIARMGAQARWAAIKAAPSTDQA